MKYKPLTLAVGALLIVLFVLLLVMFQVRQSEVAIVTTFGKPTRPITNPGPYFKWPWPIQKVYKFDQRVRNFESQFTEDFTSDNNQLMTKVYVGWRITDPAEFFPRFAGGSVTKAEQALDDMLAKAKTAVVGNHPLSDFVNADPQRIKFDAIESEMRSYLESELSTNDYGFKIVFLGIKRLGFPQSVATKVFDRMTSERNFLSSQLENEGKEQAAKIRSKADRDAAEMLSSADAEATRIVGRGYAEAADTLRTFQQNPELANFLLRLSALEDSLKENSTLVFDQRQPPFDLFPWVATNSVSR